MTFVSTLRASLNFRLTSMILPLTGQQTLQNLTYLSSKAVRYHPEANAKIERREKKLGMVYCLWECDPRSFPEMWRSGAVKAHQSRSTGFVIFVNDLCSSKIAYYVLPWFSVWTWRRRGLYSSIWTGSTCRRYLALYAGSSLEGPDYPCTEARSWLDWPECFSSTKVEENRMCSSTPQVLLAWR